MSAAVGDRLDPASVNILQQIIELGSENHDAAVASVVAMAPGTVTVVEQVRFICIFMYWQTSLLLESCSYLSTVILLGSQYIIYTLCYMIIAYELLGLLSCNFVITFMDTLVTPYNQMIVVCYSILIVSIYEFKGHNIFYSLKKVYFFLWNYSAIMY